MTVRSLVWFRGKDLRIQDHAPLTWALAGGEAILLFVLDPHYFAPERARKLAPRMRFLRASLASLEANVAHLGGRLLVVPGRSVDVVPALAERFRVDRVVAQGWTEPIGRARDRRVAAKLRAPLELLGGETLLRPGCLRTGAGAPYSVFTPFARAFAEREHEIGDPLPAPRSLRPLPGDVACPEAEPVPEEAALGLADRAGSLAGGEAAGRSRLRAFLRGPLGVYDEGRDRLGVDETSRLGADLHFGTLSARTVWAAARRAADRARPGGVRAFLRQLVWREFAHAALWDRPHLLEAPFRPAFEGFPWRDDDAGLRAWASGATGYPLVDAAARQLIAEGFVHGRARMTAASFLAKHLCVDFRRGEAHFLAHLVDGDAANNDLGWQWSAGCGCDAQPYFRVFNPTRQGERFDPDGAYVRRWVPELARMPARYVHRPWEAPALALREAGVALGETYPRPCVDHAFARERFLRLAETHLGARA